MITLKEYLNKHEVAFEEGTYKDRRQLTHNVTKLLSKVNVIRYVWNKPMIVSSGYRPASYNKTIGGSPNSAHITCEAIDIFDPNRNLQEFLTVNQELLEELDLYCEDFKYTKNWVHLTTRKPKSGKRFFRP